MLHEQDNNMLEYRPSIQDTWTPTNKIGTGGSSSEFLSYFSDNNNSATIVDDTITKQAIKDAQISVMQKNTSEITSSKVQSAITSINRLLNQISNYPDNFVYTINMLEHAKEFWTTMQDFVIDLNFTSDDIDNMTKLEVLDKSIAGEISSLINSDVLYEGETQSLEAKTFEDKYVEYRANKVNLDSVSTKCHMCSDINSSINIYAGKCEYLCDNLLGAIPKEIEVTQKQAPDLFMELSKDDVTSIFNVIGEGLMSELNTTVRIKDSSISQYNVNRNLYDFKGIISSKINVLPSMKHIFRNSNDNSDFTSAMIYDMFYKCKDIDGKFSNLFQNTIQYMHAENALLLKTYSNESKLNRFYNSVGAV